MSKRRPSPAMIVAVIALVLGLGGAAIAADLTKPQVKKIAKKVANKQIKKKAILKKDEGSLRVAHAKTADSATTAQNAESVDGSSITRVNYQADSITGPVTIFSGGGLTIQAECASGDEISVTATSNKTDSSIYTTAANTDADNTAFNGDDESGGFDADDTFNLLDGGDGDPNLVTFVFDNVDGTAITGILSADESGAGTSDCQVHGHITS